MTRWDKLLTKMRESPGSVRFEELVSVCTAYFGSPRQSADSHVVFRTPWPGDRRVNIQRGSGGKAKPYPVRQVLEAIERLGGERDA